MFVQISNFPFGLGLWGAPFRPIFGAPFWAKKSPLFNPQSSTKPTGKLPVQMSVHLPMFLGAFVWTPIFQSGEFQKFLNSFESERVAT
jgi:hypothetical protein